MIGLDRGCIACVFGGPQRRTLFLAVNEWSGSDDVSSGDLTGEVLRVTAPAPDAGLS